MLELTPKAILHLSAKGPVHPGGDFPPHIRLVRDTSVMPRLAAKLDSSTAVREYLSDLETEEVEVFVVLALDSAANLIARVNLTRGLLNQTLVHQREVFRVAIACGAAGIIVAHNHPSGNATPSTEDDVATRQLVAAGKVLDIPLYDHVIIGAGDHYSYADRARLY